MDNRITHLCDFLNANTQRTVSVTELSNLIYRSPDYTIKLFKDAEHTSKDKHVFKSWSKRNKFVIKANWIDKTHSRNICASNRYPNRCSTTCSGVVPLFPGVEF